ncbi:hypothetical protein TNCV_1513661 [Trichonephila clavipes]|nr:hypothetical protein TNCV_1513661 [Trichonephila clavipes]
MPTLIRKLTLGTAVSVTNPRSKQSSYNPLEIDYVHWVTSGKLYAYRIYSGNFAQLLLSNSLFLIANADSVRRKPTFKRSGLNLHQHLEDNGMGSGSGAPALYRVKSIRAECPPIDVAW